MKREIKFFIKDYYDMIGPKERKRIKEEYMRRYKIKAYNAFYMALSSKNHTADKLVFFAEMFGCTLDDLTKPPAKPQLRPVTEKEFQKKIEFA